MAAGRWSEGLEMISRFILLSICLVLGGCILQSPTPIFAEEDGKLILQPFGNQFVSFNLENGKWIKQSDIVKFTAVGNHYLIHDKADDIQVLFAALNSKWWVMQTNETGKPPTYLLARFEGKALVLNILSCKVLKINKAVADAINFKGEDCMANAHMTKAKFEELTNSPEPAVLKIESAK